MNALSFYNMETDEISERYIAPCFVNGLEAYDGEINLEFDENLISNDFAVKLCLDYEMRKGKKLVKKELIVALKGELYFVKFIINPKEDDVEPGVILGRSFLRLAKGIIDFGNGVITIYPKPDPFEEDSEETGKRLDDWDQLLDFNFYDMPKIGEELPPFEFKMVKSNRIKKGAMENLNMFYRDIGSSLSTGRHLTQSEAEKDALEIRINQKFALLEEERPVIETMAYHDKYKKILDEIWKDKVELDGKIMKEDEETVKRIKGEALKEKEDPEAFLFPIRLEGKVNKNTFADTGSDMNTMPYRIYEQLGKEDMKKGDRGITMINHTQTEAMGKLSNVLCQVGITVVITKFLILDIPIDRDSPIVVGRGFLCMIGGIINTSKRILSTFDRFCHQTFHATRSDYMRNAESDNDDEDEYVIKRNKIGAPIYGLRPAPYLKCTNPEDYSSAIQTTLGTHDGEAGSSPSKRQRQHETVNELLLPQDILNRMGCDGEIDEMLRIKLCEAGSNEEIFTSMAWIRAFNINEPIYAELCHEFYSTYEFDEVCADDELQTKKIIRLGLYQTAKLDEEGFNIYFEGDTKMDMRMKSRVLADSVVRSLSAPIYCRDLDTTTLRELIDSEGRLILEDPQPGVPRVGIPKPPRASMQDLYDRMGRMEIRQKAIERMEYRQSYHWDRYQGVFEHMAGVYSVPLQGAYNPLGYAQP
ncbi:pescadillo [Tanacetum coccineum]